MRLAGDAGVKAGILNGLGDTGGGECEQVEMLRTEVAGLFAFQVHDADEAVFGDERNSQLGADLGVDGYVVFGSQDVVDENGLAGEGDLADDALAHGQTDALSLDLMANLKAHAQVVSAVVEQEDGEDAVMNNGSNKLRGAVEQGFQIERGVERVSQFHEIGNVCRVNAGIDGLNRRGWAGGAIVAFKVGMAGRRWWNGRHRAVYEDNGSGK